MVHKETWDAEPRHRRGRRKFPKIQKTWNSALSMRMIDDISKNYQKPVFTSFVHHLGSGEQGLAGWRSEYRMADANQREGAWEGTGERDRG